MADFRFLLINKGVANLLGAFIIFFAFTATADAANRYWVGGADDRWELTDNWASSPRGATGATVPGSSDVAILQASGGTVRIRSAVDISGLILADVWTGSLLQGTGTLTIGSDGVRVGSGRIIGGNAAIAINGGYTQTGGIVTGIQNNFTLSGSLSVTKGAAWASTFTSTGTLVFDGGADQNFTVGANVTKTFTNLTLNNTGGGTSDDIVTSVNGTLNLSGALTITLGNLDLSTNSQAMAVENGITLADDTQASLTTDSNITASGTILVNDSAVLTVSDGTLTLNDDGDQSVDLDGQTINNLTLNNTGGGTNDDVIIAGGGLNLSGALTVTLGNLDMDTNTQTLVVDGNATLADSAQASLSGATMFFGSGVTVHSSATFSHKAGTVTLDGTTNSLSGSITFFNLTKTVSSADTLTVAATTTLTITNTLTLNGADGADLSLRSSLTGTEWYIDPQGTRSTTYLDVKDSHNTNAAAIDCTTGCTDSGNTALWDFGSSSSSSSSSSSTTTSTSSGGGGGGRRIAEALQKQAEASEISTTNPIAVMIDGALVEFSDVLEDVWFASYVQFVLESGFASGYKDARGRLTGKYGPANNVTYAEIAKMALEAGGHDVSSVTTDPSNRSARGQWSASYIKLAEDIGLSVYSPSLNVNATATRGAVVQTILEATGTALDENVDTEYNDLSSSHQFARALSTATRLGVISGDTDADGNPLGTVRPNDNINRAEVAKILSIMLQGK